MVLDAGTLQRVVSRMLEPLKRKLNLIVGRAVLEAAKNADGMLVMKVSLLSGEAAEDLEFFQSFGHASMPVAGSEGIAAAVGGNRNHLVLLAMCDRQNRPGDLAEGESSLYSTGVRVYARADGTIELGGVADFVAMAAKVETELNALKDAINTHTHAVSTTGSASAQSGTAAPAAGAAGAVGAVGSEVVKLS